LALSSSAIYGIDILLQNLLVPLDLHLRHANVDVDFLLRKQTLFDIVLDSSEQKWSENLVQLLDDRVLVSSLRLEPLIECGTVAEDIGKQEVEKSPEFVQIVLEGSTSDEQSVTRVEDPDDLSKGGFLVLN